MPAKTRNIAGAQWLRIPSTRKGSVPRYHPYRRPVYPDEEDGPYQPRVEDDSLLYMIQVAPGPVPAIVERREDGEGHVEEENYGFIVGVVLLLEFLALSLMVKQLLFLEFIFRHGQANGE
ncbi:hypothetical protein VNI00_011370 [Paramarasmius palmivorus]|uniref:Uncharacterized protein n=1 Tax=Paramarasmius palmivorus TaxID=297713 RepID=A0AAW0CEU2_9AGAR